MKPTQPSVLITNAHLFDPSNGVDYKGAVLVKNGRIEDTGLSIKAGNDVQVIDAGGMHLFPAFCDPHVHFRTPGQTHKEDIESGSRAALAGGFTSVIQMPNTSPVIDTPELVRDMTRDEPIELRVMGAVTLESRSRELTDFEALREAGAVGFSDDGTPVSEFVFMKAALTYSSEAGVPIASHAEDTSFGLGGIVRMGMIAESLGVPGWNPKRESAMVERDLKMARKFGGHIHVCHVSTTESVDFLRRGRKHDISMSAEVTPHHLGLTIDAVSQYGADAKMNPPLGTEEDRQILIEALADGTIDCIATDHAPHTPEEKSTGLMRAPFGVIGLETSFAVVYTELVKPGRITLNRLIDAMSHVPREIYNLEKVGLYKGSRADMTLVDLERTWVVEPGKFESKARNCPFAQRELGGKVLWTMYRGDVAWKSKD